MLLLLGCAHHAAPATASPTPLDAQACAKLLDESLKLMDSHPVEADAAYADGYTRCGPGSGFLEARTFVSFAGGRWDEGGEHLVRAVTEPGPTLLTIKLVASGLSRFSPELQARFRGLGSTAEHPVYVPDISVEYAWIALVNCGVETRVPATQALVAGPNGMLDVLTFTCPDPARSGAVYFDYSADPMEQAFKKELEGK